ncbi:MAG: riboflavin synthase [Candidatus Zixiibacteriota bacterium]
MFTGIIESVGTVQKIEPIQNYLIISISHSYPVNELKIGESICCDGACLTVVVFDKQSFQVEVSQETHAKTISKSYQIGSQVNLERAIKVGDRLGGHFVTGHVDDSAMVTELAEAGKSLILTIQYDNKFDRLVVAKGSIAINGVSLTVNEIGSGWCEVNLIPHTLEHTNLSRLKVDDRVNVEFDLIGKYATGASNQTNVSTLTFAKLEESGW